MLNLKPFKKVLDFGSRVYDHVNPFDSGRSFTTRSPDLRKKKQSSLEQLKDVFDANTQYDKTQRVSQGRAADYVQDQRNMGNNRPYTNPAQYLIGSASRYMNTGAAATAEAIETGRGLVADFTNNDSALRASNERIRHMKELMYDPNFGLANAGTIFHSPEDRETVGAAEMAKRMAGTTAGAATEVVPVFRGLGAMKHGRHAAKAAKTLNKAPKSVQVGAKTTGHFAEGVTGDVAEQLSFKDGINIDPRQAAAAGAFSVAMPAAMQGAKQASVKLKHSPAATAVDKMMRHDPKTQELLRFKDSLNRRWNAAPPNSLQRKQIEKAIKEVNKELSTMDGFIRIPGGGDDVPTPKTSSSVDPELKQRLQEIRIEQKYGPLEARAKEMQEAVEAIEQGDKIKAIFGNYEELGSKKVTPKVEKIDGGYVNKTTGEFLEDRSQLLKEKVNGNFIGGIRDIDPLDLTPEENRAVVDTLRETFNRDLDNLIDHVEQKAGVSFEEFSQAVQRHARTGEAMPENIKAAADDYKKAIERLREVLPDNTGKVDYYIPQTRKDAGPATIESGSTLISEVDSEFQFGKKRENLIPLEELDYSDQPLRRLGDQLIHNKFKKRAQVEDLMAKQQAKGIDLNFEQAKQAVEKQSNLAETIKDTTRKGSVFDSEEGIATKANKIDFVGKLNDVTRSKGEDLVELDTSVSFAGRQLSSSKEVYSKVKLPNGQTLHEASGYSRYVDSRGIDHAIFDEINNSNANPGEYLRQRYQDVPLEPEVKERVITKAEKALERQKKTLQDLEVLATTETDPKQQAYFQQRLEDLNDPIVRREAEELVYLRAEREIAREQFADFLSKHNIKDKQLKKMLNQDALRIFTQDNAVRTLGDNTIDLLTGAGYQGALGYNIFSAAQNLLELKRPLSEYGYQDLKYAVKNLFKQKDLAEDYGLDRRNYADPTGYGHKKDTRNVLKPMGLFNRTEELKDRFILLAAEHRYASQGLTGTALRKKVMNEAKDLGLKYGQEGSLGFSKSKTGRLFGQFMQYNIKAGKLFGRKVKEGFLESGLDSATKKRSRGYVYKILGYNTATYLTLSAAIGSSWEYTYGIFNPLGDSYVDKDAPLVDKTVAKVPGGPAVGLMKELYLGMREEMREAEAEQREFELSNAVTKPVKRGAATMIPGGNQFLNKTYSFQRDQDRGYNESHSGNARFPAATSTIDKIRGYALGPYATSEAQKYFGSEGVAGDLPDSWRKTIGLPDNGDRNYPVADKFQDKIKETIPQDDDLDTMPKPYINEVARMIEESRKQNRKKEKFFKDNPQGEAIYQAIYDSTYNPETGKYENDVLSPEKWKKIATDQSLETYEYFKQRQLDDAKEFGREVDPIYQLNDKERVREVLELRSRPTGDDIEREEILRATTDWYSKFEDAEADYYSKMDFSGDKDSKYGPSERKAKWQEISKMQSKLFKDQPDFVKKYWELKDSNPDGAKEYFKNNADRMTAYFDHYRKEKLKLINAKRELEGYPPIDDDTFNNVTFGYEDDERKVARELYYKLNGSGGYGSGSGSSRASSTHKYAVSLGAAGRVARPRVRKIAAKKYKNRAKNLSAMPKVSIRKSKV